MKCRLLDPLLAASYRPAILPREKGIVVSLEAVKMVLTEDAAYVTNLEDPVVAALAEEVCRRLALRGSCGGGGGSVSLRPSKSLADLGGAAGTAVASGGVGAQLQLPFELQVLEVALETVRGGGACWQPP